LNDVLPLFQLSSVSVTRVVSRTSTLPAAL
jgi:hypothetical protein